MNYDCRPHHVATLPALALAAGLLLLAGGCASPESRPTLLTVPQLPYQGALADPFVGPVLADAPDAMEKSLVNHHPLPLRHGMTLGELAGLFADDLGDAGSLRLEVVKMIGWRRQDAFDRTGLTWAAPSPNAQMVLPVMFDAISLTWSTSSMVAVPAMILSNRRSSHPHPSRHGVHCPQDSCL